MLHHLEEYGKYAVITGYRNVSFALAEAFLKANRKQPMLVDIQFFDADLIATQEHLYFAVLNALQAFRGKTAVSKTVAVETMLYASAKRQIQKAIDQIGIKPQTNNMAVVALSDEPSVIEAVLQALSAAIGCEPDDTVLELTKEKQEKISKVFQISPKELEAQANSDMGEALVDSVVEQVALLSTQI